MILSLQLFSKFKNNFLKIHDINDNPIIIYTSFGNLFVPSCTILGEIQIISNTSRCFEHVPVTFKYKNGSINAFLRDYNIISKTSKSIDCESVQPILDLVSNSLQIKRNKTFNIIEAANTEFYEKLNLAHYIFNYNFHHKQEIIDSIDLRRTDEQFMHANEFAGPFIVSSDSVNSESLLQLPADEFRKISNKITHKTQLFFNSVKKIIIVFFILVTFICFILLFVYFRHAIIRLYIMVRDIIRKSFQHGQQTPEYQLKDTTPQSIRFDMHTPDTPKLFPILPQHNQEDDKVSLDTRNLTASYVQQIPVKSLEDKLQP
jgi:hypothetical protein